MTPATFSNLYSGSHTVYVSKSGYSSVSRTVTVSAGSTTQVSVTLSQIAQDTGSIYMVTTPQGANAYVDGTYYGITPALATGLTAGNHEVKLDLTPLWLKLQTIKGVFATAYVPMDGKLTHVFDLAIDLVRKKRVDLKEMITHTFTLEQFPRMIETNLAKSRNGAVKTMVKFTGNQEVNQ